MREEKFRTMRGVALFAFIFVAVNAWGGVAEETGSARLRFGNLNKKAESAMVYITVFQSQKEWDSERGTEMEALAGAQKEVVIENLFAQTYGFSAYVDLNGNGKLDSNALGIPKEPWALSKLGSKTPLGKPSWRDIAVTIQKGEMTDVPLHFHD